MQPNSICPKGSTVLVTGANGFVASHIVDQLLQLGYKVRGTVRNIATKAYLEGIFHGRHNPELFSAVIVPDLAVARSCDDVLSGCTGVVHAAANMSMSPDMQIIPSTIAIVQYLLESAARTPSVVRFVYTGTCNSAVEPGANKYYHIDSNSFNDTSLPKTRLPPPHPINQGFLVYYAAKSEAEKLAWQFVREKQPGFIFNAVHPNLNLGPILTLEQPRGCYFLKLLYDGVPQVVDMIGDEVIFPPGQCGDVRDTARLHIAALTEADVQNERLFATHHPFNYNELIRLMKLFAPEGKVLPEEKEGLAENGQTVDEQRSLELLKRMGREGWAPVEDAMRESCLGEEVNK